MRIRDQQLRDGRIRLDLLPQAVDVRLQRVRRDGRVVAPDCIQQRLPGNRPVAGEIQKLQKRRLLGRQPDPAVLHRLLQQLGRRTEGVGTDSEECVFAVLKRAHLRPQPSQSA
jgi:hypothetical protein